MVALAVATLLTAWPASLLALRLARGRRWAVAPALAEFWTSSRDGLTWTFRLRKHVKFHHGREVTAVPLLTLFGASNELPEEDELLALQDRFLLRYQVGYIEEDFRFLKLLQGRPGGACTTLPLAMLAEARAEAAALPVPGQVLRAVTDLRRELGRKSIVASDRRWVQAVGALRAHAYLAGRDTVGEEDLPFLEHVLWRDPAERAQIRATIRELLVGYEDEVRVLLYQSRELRDYALRPWDTGELRSRAALEAHTKVRSILSRVDTILSHARSGGRPLGRVEALREEIAAIEQEMGARR